MKLNERISNKVIKSWNSADFCKLLNEWKKLKMFLTLLLVVCRVNESKTQMWRSSLESFFFLPNFLELMILFWHFLDVFCFGRNFQNKQKILSLMSDWRPQRLKFLSFFSYLIEIILSIFLHPSKFLGDFWIFFCYWRKIKSLFF